MRHCCALRATLVFGLLAVLLLGCSRDPNVRKQKYLRSGEQYFQKGSYREAAIEFTNAVQIDPAYADAHYQLAQVYLKLQQWANAYRELARTLELQPENYPARMDLANLLLAAGDLKLAREQTDLLLAKQGNDPHVHLLAAALHAAQEDLTGAMQETQKAIVLAPNRSESYLTLARLQMRANQPDAAEPNFKKAVELDANSAGAQLALGAYYQTRGRFVEAEQQFRQAVDAAPKSVDPRTALVRFYMALGEKAHAEAVLKQAKQDFSDNPDGYRMLGDFYFAAGDLDKAIAEYAALFQEHPRDLQVKKNYIQLLILKNRMDEARKLDDEILKTNAHDPEALVYRGQLQLRNGQTNEAVASLQDAVQSAPQNAVTHYHLGVAFDQQGNAARAENEWREAVRLRPDLAEAHRALANLALRQNDMDSLQQTASEIIKLQPQAADGYALRAVAFINRNQFSNAEQDVRKIIQIAPLSPAGYVQMGNLRLAQKKYRDAEAAYQQALGRDAASAEALSGLMKTYLAQKQVDKAVAAANAQIAKVSNSSGFYDLLGTVLFNDKKDLPGAESALKKSLELDRNNTDALLKLGQVLSAKGASDEAIAAYQRYLQDHPRDVGFHVLTGELYESKHDWERARQMYQRALDLSPKNAVAANNLAAVLLQTGGNVDTALSLAETARRGMPESADAADTLGRVYYQKGLYKPAIDAFQDALKLSAKSKNSDDAGLHYRLALAYQKTGQSGLAKQHLEKVLKIDPKFGDAGEVRKLLARL